MSDEGDVVYFTGPAEFRAWLRAHHDRADVLWVGFHKKSTGVPSLTWPESVDEALCFGWIDGVRRSVDGDRYTIRFTPRKPASHWSARNLERVEALRSEGRMTPAGEAAFALRDEARTARASYERESAELGGEAEAELRANPAAWAYWSAQPPGYRRTVTWWVISARREETRRRRLARLIEDCAAGRRIGPLRRKGDG